MDLVALLVLAAAHCLIDTFALTLQPLWPDLQARTHAGDVGIQCLYVLWSLASSASQLAFGFWADRARARWMIWGGAALAIVSLGLAGLPTDPWTLGALLLLAGLGVGAFHPEAAALVGVCAPERRSFGVSIFVIGGGWAWRSVRCIAGY